MRKTRGARKTDESLQAVAPARPDIFRYHDYRSYLKGWLAFLKASQPSFSLTSLAERSSLSVSYLSMVISGDRNLTDKAMVSLAAALQLSDSERDYLNSLLSYVDGSSAEERQDSYRRMARMPPYRKLNPAENRTYEYMSHWHYVAIREMAALPEFRLDPEWIQSRLRYKLSLREIREALGFLRDNRLIEISPEGRTTPSKEALNCEGGVYRLALGSFHHEMLSKASASIEVTPSEERNILGYTLAVDRKHFLRIRQLLDELQRELADIAQEAQDPDQVVHVEMALFPLTQGKKKD